MPISDAAAKLSLLRAPFSSGILHSAAYASAGSMEIHTMQRFVLALMIATTLSIRSAEPTTLAIGASAPDFNLKGVDDKMYSLKDFAQAKILVVLFTSNHCPTAQAYEERIKKLVDDYKAKGVALVGINPNSPKGLRLDELGYTDLGDTLDDMKLRAAEKKFNFPYVDDGDTQATAIAYGCKVTPHAFVFDAERKLRYVGRIDDNEREELAKTFDLRNALEAMVAGKEVEVNETKCFGCSTKWANKEASVKAWMEKIAKEPVAVEMVDEEGLKALRKNENGKYRLVNFWATTCGPCVTEFPELITINRMYRHRNFEMVTVAANFPDQKEEVLKFLQKEQASCKNLLFGGTDKYKLMAAFDKDWDCSLPYTVLINPKGEVVYKKNGAIDELELRRAIVNVVGRMIK
jgi:thiol-disulfide isomerase/thioredoxin